VPGSSMPGPNGLEISRDGRWLYVGGWGSQSVVRLSRGQTPVKKDSVAVGFYVDNVRWAPDGSLLAAGQGGTSPSQVSHVARVNTTTMTSQELVRYPFSDMFAMGTVAIQVGREIWVGTYRGNRIAIFPARP
jgi:sugar lactone lactonase YvrE